MGVYKLKQDLRYGCKEGYKGKANSATCTENGWEPKPLCIGMYTFSQITK